MYAVPSISGLMTSNKRQQRNNKTTTTAATNQSIKPKKKTKKQAKKVQHKTRIRDREITRGKIIHFLQIFTDIAFNPWPGSCCNAQRYGNNDGG